MYHHPSYEEGRADEKKKWIESLLPETMMITIQVRDKNDQVESIRRVVSFEEIKQGRNFMFRYLEELILKIYTAKIIRNIIEEVSHPSTE